MCSRKFAWYLFVKHLKVPQIGFKVLGAVGWHEDPRRARASSPTAAQSRGSHILSFFRLHLIFNPPFLQRAQGAIIFWPFQASQRPCEVDKIQKHLHVSLGEIQKAAYPSQSPQPSQSPSLLVQFENFHDLGEKMDPTFVGQRGSCPSFQKPSRMTVVMYWIL